MKALAPIFVAIILQFSCSNQEIIISEDLLPEDRFCYADPLTPYTGKCIVMYRNSSQIKAEMHYKDGLLDGSWTSYYVDGKIKQKGEYKGGMFNGKWESWSNNGSKLYEVHYKNDILYGRYLIFGNAGKLKEKGQYEANKRVGTWSWYNEKGELMSRDNFKVN